MNITPAEHSLGSARNTTNEMKELPHYVGAFSSLHTAKTKGRKAPHKAVLLLAIIDLIEEGLILTPRIGLTDELNNKFHAIWSRYVGTSTLWRPNIGQPYFHMQHESFWMLVESGEAVRGKAAGPMPYVEPSKWRKELPRGGYTVEAMRRDFAYAAVDGVLFELLQNTDARAMLRTVLISTYLTDQPTKAMPNLYSLIAALPLLALVA